MTLIKSISGIRGTIGGEPSMGLTPVDVVKYTTAFARLMTSLDKGRTIVIGRDARTSGEMVRNLVCGTLQGMGMDVLDLGLSTTPTVEIAVKAEGAAGGIIITASHNPTQWNALKLLNAEGEFISAAQGQQVLDLAEDFGPDYAESSRVGRVRYDSGYMGKHISQILDLPLVDREAIRKAGFSVVLDAVNSTGGIFIPELLRALGVHVIREINCIPDGKFSHNPEPLAENLTELCAAVLESRAHLGIAVDPDVDRLVFVSEDGKLFGEEYTLVAVADYVLEHTPGNTVSNLSSTRALQDVTEAHGGTYLAAAVGEVNVVTRMKETHAVIGGEGNGGVIYPELHYGRDALVGVALFLSHLARLGISMTEMKQRFNPYHISKNKITIPAGVSVDAVLGELLVLYQGEKLNLEDGIRIDYPGQWVHLRRSNTEPIVRIIAESGSELSATELAGRVIKDFERVFQRQGLKGN